MMRFSFCFFILIMFCGEAKAEYYNAVSIDSFNFKLSKKSKGRIIVENTKDNQLVTCKITGWNDELSKNGGVISLTSDNLGVIINSASGYVSVEDLIKCKGESVKLKRIQFYHSDLAKLIDVNFKHKLALAIIVMDARLDEYQAIVSSFNGKKNLIAEKGFWNDNPSGEVSEDDTFYVGDNYYKGKISSDGNYVSPVELDCSSEAFPGVWDIKEKKRVLFNDREGPLSIDEKCKILMSGKKTLRELQGELIE